LCPVLVAQVDRKSILMTDAEYHILGKEFAAMRP
jgi:hypothetical protein